MTETRCGTVRGYFDHRSAREQTCVDCRKAKRDYQTTRRTTYGTCRSVTCDAPVEARGWCSHHLDLFYRHGNAEHPRPSIYECFWAKVALGPIPEYAPDLGPCWLWTGNKWVQGYGAFRQLLAHRFAYEHMVTEIPRPLTIDHLCRVRLCVNPSHLEPVTRAENSRREMSARSAM